MELVADRPDGIEALAMAPVRCYCGAPLLIGGALEEVFCPNPICCNYWHIGE